MQDGFLISPLGDSALTINFGNRIDENLNKKVLQLFTTLQQLAHPAIIDLVPAYSSLAVHYHVAALHFDGRTAFQQMKTLLEPLAAAAKTVINNEGPPIKIPVCYRPEMAPDLIALASLKNMEVEEVIQLHTQPVYRVYTIGFLPGFAYMATVDERIAVSRKNAPVSVAAGSVGIAGQQTGIYPLASPGGWQIIGRTPVKMFGGEYSNPVFLKPGDEVQFYSITENEFANY